MADSRLSDGRLNVEVIARSGEALLVADGPAAAIVYPDGEFHVGLLAVLAGHGQWRASSEDVSTYAPAALAAALATKRAALEPQGERTRPGDALRAAGHDVSGEYRLPHGPGGGRWGRLIGDVADSLDDVSFDERARHALTGDEGMRAFPGGGLDDPTVARYARSGGYRNINDALTAADGDLDRVTLGSRGYFADDADLRSTIATFDDLMAGSRSDHDVVGVRVLRDPQGAFGGQLRPGQDNTGLTWTSRRYTSLTTGDEAQVTRQRFRLGTDDEGETGMRQRLLIPAGSSAVRGNESEQELILPRDTTYRIAADRGMVDGLWDVDVEVLP